MRLRLAILAALVIFWATVGWLAKEASAQTTNPVTLAVQLAERYWHIKPCSGHIQIEANEAQPSLVEGPRFGPALMWAHVGSCTFTIDTHYWPSWQYDDAYFQWFCDGVVHELGHLAPLDHSDIGQTDPASIEYPLLEPSSANYSSVPECRHVNSRPIG